jgi:hypothetical protein
MEFPTYDDGAAARAPRRRPHVCAEGGYGCEEDEEAVCANVDFRVGFAHAERVGRFGEELVREEVVACRGQLCVPHTHM